DARQRDVHQAVEELPHAFTAQGDHRGDRHPLPDLERGDRLLCAARHWLLARDARELVGAGVNEFGIRRGLTQPHIDDDLLDARHRHHVPVSELLLQRRHHVLLVPISQPAHLSTTPSHLRHTRTFRPSPRILCPMGVCAPHSGHTSWTFEAFSDASRSTMPPLTFLPGFGFVCRLIMFTPSTMSRFFSGRTLSTRPRLPRSFPVITTTVSFFRIGVANLDITHSPALTALRAPT